MHITCMFCESVVCASHGKICGFVQLCFDQSEQISEGSKCISLFLTNNMKLPSYVLKDFLVHCTGKSLPSIADNVYDNNKAIQNVNFTLLDEDAN